MKVVHISGTPGSGKTTLGGQIACNADPSAIVVKDTDEFTDDFDQWDADKEPANAGRLWLNHIDRHVRDFLANQADKKLVVLLGILDRDVTLVDGRMVHVLYEMPSQVERIFLDVTPAVLLKQYYERVVTMANSGVYPWADIAEGRVTPVLGSDQKLAELQFTRVEHRAHGYAVMTRDEILRTISDYAAMTLVQGSIVMCSMCTESAAVLKARNSGLHFCGLHCYRLLNNRLTSTGSGQLRLLYVRTGGIMGRHEEVRVFDDGTAILSYRGGPTSTDDRLPIIGNAEAIFDWALHAEPYDQKRDFAYDQYHFRVVLYDKDGKTALVEKRTRNSCPALDTFVDLISWQNESNPKRLTNSPLRPWTLIYTRFDMVITITGGGAVTITRSKTGQRSVHQLSAPEDIFRWAMMEGKAESDKRSEKQNQLILVGPYGKNIISRHHVSPLPKEFWDQIPE